MLITLFNVYSISLNVRNSYIFKLVKIIIENFLAVNNCYLNFVKLLFYYLNNLCFCFSKVEIVFMIVAL